MSFTEAIEAAFDRLLEVVPEEDRSLVHEVRGRPSRVGTTSEPSFSRRLARV
jgi:hypothetical protein